MAPATLRVGLIGAGGNTRLRHIPGLRAIPGVDIVAVCNRRPSSTEAVASAYDIPRTFATWEDLIADPHIDAVVIGTWPYLHCPITLAALEAGQPVLTEADEHERGRGAACLQPHANIRSSSRRYRAEPVRPQGRRRRARTAGGGFLGGLREFACSA
jgi:hypothetical protein